MMRVLLVCALAVPSSALFRVACGTGKVNNGQWYTATVPGDADATQAACCVDATCDNAWDCDYDSGWEDKYDSSGWPNRPTITGDPTNALCCDRSCGSYDCPAGYRSKSFSSPPTSAQSTAVCCDVVVGKCAGNKATATGLVAGYVAGTYDFDCGATKFLIANPANTPGADEGVCCRDEVSGMCAGNSKLATGLVQDEDEPNYAKFDFDCPLGHGLIANAGSTTGNTATACCRAWTCAGNPTRNYDLDIYDGWAPSVKYYGCPGSMKANAETIESPSKSACCATVSSSSLSCKDDSAFSDTGFEYDHLDQTHTFACPDGKVIVDNPRSVTGNTEAVCCQTATCGNTYMSDGDLTHMCPDGQTAKVDITLSVPDYLDSAKLLAPSDANCCEVTAGRCELNAAASTEAAEEYVPSCDPLSDNFFAGTYHSACECPTGECKFSYIATDHPNRANFPRAHTCAKKSHLESEYFTDRLDSSGYTERDYTCHATGSASGCCTSYADAMQAAGMGDLINCLGDSCDPGQSGADKAFAGLAAASTLALVAAVLA